MSQLTEFYDETGCDSEGRTLSQIWAKDDDYLEFEHNWVQWVFPLQEPSNFNPDAPLLTEEDIAVFKANPTIHANLILSFRVFLGFLWLHYDGDEVTPSKEYFQPAVFKIANHNWLRITRVLNSLRILGCEKEAIAFYKFLKKIHEEDGWVSENSFSYWTKAVELS